MPGFIYPVNSDFHVNQLLISTDLLITDYSSIPFEFSFWEDP
ncbi:CDP-glycerol glycerophosphotransferase family protein [[Brevibacterium] frigoritolerans]|uniref:CDP-glycerol glycerophosphotransferase family protein n=1 Tax=Peribacillus frigoritolerans TaxID=450367 RepID=A0A941FK94_9BACI|nr:CDP-glycerol glycerophosphotransferase family protein [Peribacillus frigoritolerans]